MAINKIKTNSITDSAVTSATIQDSAVTNAKISACAAIAQSKVTGLTTSLSNLSSSATALTGLINTNQFNIGLLGFKMAITEGLTVFNLVDGIVDEFEDESGVDNSASTTLTYNSTDDYYINSTNPDGQGIPMASYSAGFAVASITEPDTSTTATNPSYGTGSVGTFTVPSDVTSINAFIWGAGGGGGLYGASQPGPLRGGGGGFVTGILAVTPAQVLNIDVAEGGFSGHNPQISPRPANPGTVLPGGKGGLKGGGAPATVDSISACSTGYAGGGGLSGVLVSSISYPTATAPQVYLIAGGGGGSGHGPTGSHGGAGGGLIGDSAESQTEQTTGGGPSLGGGGSQTVGGSKASGGPMTAYDGFFLGGGNGGDDANLAGGGAGYYGGGGGTVGPGSAGRSAGGGSSYFGHPQISSGSTEEGAACEGGGINSPLYISSTNEGGVGPTSAPTFSPAATGEDGYVLITSTAINLATVTSSTIISDPFTANTVPTTSRIVVFEENVGTPSLNTDIIASVSRNGGTNFTNVTLADSGYVTGSSGQRILTGTATISGQPSGQSMKWKLQLANNTVKIHGVALQWS